MIADAPYLADPGSGVSGLYNRARGTGKKAFTLIELLVVIGIIGVLTSILVPVVIGGIDGARKAACAASLRNMGTSMLTYRRENEDQLPVILNSTSSYTIWNGTDYLGFGKLVERGLVDINGLYCPASNKSKNELGMSNVNVPGENVKITYYQRGNVQGAPTIAGESQDNFKALLQDLESRNGVMKNHDDYVHWLTVSGNVNGREIPKEWEKWNSNYHVDNNKGGDSNDGTVKGSWSQLDYGTIEEIAP